MRADALAKHKRAAVANGEWAEGQHVQDVFMFQVTHVHTRLLAKHTHAHARMALNTTENFQLLRDS